MTKRVLRYEVTDDGELHEIPTGRVVFFGRRQQNPFGIDNALEVWVEVPTPDGWPAVLPAVETRSVRVVRTAQAIDDTWAWVCSAMDGQSVLHLFEVVA